jgi:hypothetical protein
LGVGLLVGLILVVASPFEYTIFDVFRRRFISMLWYDID